MIRQLSQIIYDMFYTQTPRACSGKIPQGLALKWHTPIGRNDDGVLGFYPIIYLYITEIQYIIMFLYEYK